MGRLRFILRLAARLTLLAVLVAGGWWLASDPESPLPPGWHPTRPLDVSAPTGGLTNMALRRATADEGMCLAALGTGAVFREMAPLEAGPQCGIGSRVELQSVGGLDLDPMETSCAAALRLAMWVEHGVKPAAAAQGFEATGLRHQGSYNCRTIRGGTRMSLHATARAIDIAGVRLADGRRLELREGWNGADEVGAFWQDVHSSACRWFVTVLGPEFNALHADHFHLQSAGWGTCR